MSNGGYKGSTPARETSPEQYPGVWELTEQFQAQADGNWPFQETDCAPKSLRFDSASGAYLAKTPSSAGNRRVFTFSCWYKRAKFGSREQLFSAAGSTNTYIEFQDDQLMFEDYNPAANIRVRTNRVFRDPSAFYSIVISVDTTISSPESDRVKIFINGVRETSFVASGSSYGTLNYQTSVNSTGQHKFGQFPGNTSFPLDGLICDAYLIDGQALTPDAFTFIDGQGIIQPKRFTGDYSSGPVYSNFLTGGIDSSYPAPNGFDGVTSGIGVRTSANGTMVWQPSAPIGFNNSFKIYCSLDGSSYGNTFTVTHAGGTTDFTSSVVTNTTNTAVDLALISGVTSPISKITVASGGSNPRFSAIEQDGQILVDATVGRNSFHLDFADSSSNAALGYDSSGVGNDWTVNNLNASSGLSGTIGVSGDSIQFYGRGGSGTSDITETLTVNGTQLYSGTGMGSYTIPNSYLPISSWSVAGSSSGNVYVTAITVNGTRLSGGNYALGLSGVHGSFNGGLFAAASNGSVYGGQPGTISYSSSVSIETDSLVDSPVNGNQTDPSGLGGIVQGNYATWNPLDKSSSLILSNGNLDAAETTGAGHFAGRATFKYPATGKWYYEATITTLGGACCIGVDTSGLANPSLSNSGVSLILVNSSNNVQRYIGSSYTSFDSAYGNPAVGSVLQVAYDADADKLWLGMDNVWMGSGSSANGNPGAGSEATASNVSDPFPVTNLVTSALAANFGARAFTHAAPNGYSALCTANLPDPTIADPSKYFDTKLYTGNGSTQTVSGYNFSPDFLWLKQRSGTNWHELYDTIRGKSVRLFSNDTSGDDSSTSLTAFNSDGFSLNNTGGGNVSSSSNVAWAWDAGDSTTTIAAGGVPNSSLYLQDAVYSDSSNFTYTGTSGFTSGSGLDKLFDGRTDTQVDQIDSWSGGTSAHLTWTPATAIPVTSTLRIYGRWYTDTANNVYLQRDVVTINGSSTEIQDTVVNSTSNHWHDLSSYIQANNITSITEIKGISYPKGGNRLDPGFMAIEVDGKILVDSGVTPPSVPSLASTVRANPSAGFSIVSYAGNSSNNATIGHGLNAAPELIITKNRDAAYNWITYSAELAATKVLALDGTYAAFTPSGGYYSNVGSSTYQLVQGSANLTNVNNSGNDYIAYCFAPVEGYSAMGSYIGNGSTDGPFLFTGFKVAWLLAKRSDSTSSWQIWDGTRDVDNVTTHRLRADLSNAEDTGAVDIDILSNGFKLRNTGINVSGGTYVYLAFASHPFKTARAR